MQTALIQCESHIPAEFLQINDELTNESKCAEMCSVCNDNDYRQLPGADKTSKIPTYNVALRSVFNKKFESQCEMASPYTERSAASQQNIFQL